MKKEKILKTLKVICKVLIVAYACIGVICTAVLMVSAIKNKLYHDDNSSHQINVVATTPLAKGAHSNDGYIYWGSMGDFYDNDFLTNFLNKIQETYGSIANSMQLANINMQVGSWSNFTYDGTTPYLTTYQNVDSIWCTYVGNGASNDVVYYYYTMDFYNGNTKIFWFQFLVFPAYEDNNGIHWFDTTYGTNPTNINYRIVDSDLFMQDNVYYFSVGGATNNYNLKLWLDIDPTESDYNKGYQDGYNSGYQNGYASGYNVGYEVGGMGLSSNPFNLIKNAFSAVGNILNIQILPNLPLGVLIFTPLIVVLVIAVVKIFRG